MKILVFSDSHLDHNFEPEKLSFLQKRIEESDQVILNGDFWEGYSISFEYFLKSDWRKLFPSLKKKQTIYIYGNHDKKTLSDERVKQFCDTAIMQYRLKTKQFTYVFEHGNRVVPFFDDLLHIKRLPTWLNDFLAGSESRAVQLLGEQALPDLYGKFNMDAKKKIPKLFKPSEVLVCGHTHVAEVDLANRFVNSGLVRHGLAQYLIFENGLPVLYKDRYR